MISKKFKEIIHYVRILILYSWKFIVVISVLFGIVIGYFALLNPNISISTGLPELDITDPLSTLFIISNNGPLQVNSMEIDCQVNEIKTKGEDFRNNGFILYSLPKTLDPGEDASIPCGFRNFIGLSKDDSVLMGDITFIVTLKLKFNPYKFTRKVRFVTYTSSDGDLHWFPQPNL